ncbi:MAG: cation:proton antiporter [Bacteroidales bacterium]|nr:cation:proton antiporter [Bacteroidales bacterium]
MTFPSDFLTLPLTQPVVIITLVLVIILCAPILFSRLKIPNIVGLILAGVAVGPYGFNLLARDASFEIFGQVGILYLMFLAAVEIDMYHLKRNYRSGVVFGLVTFLLPMAVGIPLTKFALDISWTSSVLISSMYASHTLISYPVVSKFGLTNNRGAVIAVCGTIVAVLLALLALAEVVAVRVSGHFDVGSLFWLLLLMGIYAVGVGWSFPKLTRWFFRKTSDSVMQFIFILTLVLIASTLAKVIGLESILGAFYAGLVLNPFIPSRSALMNRISFVGNAIFIPYFLIGVGMLINVHVIFRGWGVAWAAGVMTLTALVTKWVAAWGSQRIIGLGSNERRLMFGLSSGKAAATIAATMIGYQYGLLTEDMMNGAVVMILVCCIVASVTTETAAKSIRISLTAAALDNEAPRRVGFARQIVAVSNPLTAEGIMRMAVFMRSPLNTETITALFVRRSDNPELLRDGRQSLNLAVAAAEAVDVPCRQVERFDLNIMAGVTNVMREHHATEVVIGLHRRTNIVDSFFGSMIDQLMRSTNRMIIMARCFIPVDTVRRIFVYVPRNAQYESGFSDWIARIGNLASQLSCRVHFLCQPVTGEYIEAHVAEGGYAFSRQYAPMENWDDFIILSSQVGEEDLLIVIGARKGSVSYTGDYENMPSFLGRNFRNHNITLVIPSQFDGKVNTDSLNPR